jgi:hypothetical protein
LRGSGPGNFAGEEKGEMLLAAFGGVGIVGIIVVVLIVLAIVYFVRR